jgi:hypothetical protein
MVFLSNSKTWVSTSCTNLQMTRQTNLLETGKLAMGIIVTRATTTGIWMKARDHRRRKIGIGNVTAPML